MIFWAVIDSDGYVTRAGSLPALPAGALVLPDGISPADGFGFRWVDGQFSLRPRLPEPVVVPYEVTGLSAAWSGLPDGTICVIEDAAIGAELARMTAVAGVMAFDLIDPGQYEINLIPPRPHMPQIITLEIAP